MPKIVIQTILMLGLLTLGSFLLNLKVKYHLRKMNIDITDEQSKEIKWLVSSTVTILTALSYLLYLVLSH